jgi:hypothetical protein
MLLDVLAGLFDFLPYHHFLCIPEYSNFEELVYEWGDKNE